jgi:3-deoxy-manno-octulosonate cytidylyltransferase (CMP-KDO synthetase)
MKTAIIIPSRLGSVRLPRKPLALISGMSLVERVWRGCKRTGGIEEVFIATDSDEIARHAESFGAKYIMTPQSCESGTERVAIAAYELPKDIDIVINVQGDEPLVEPAVIEEVVKYFEMHSQALIVTPVTPLREAEDLSNPNVVKATLASDGRVLYFSRSAIPLYRDSPFEPKEGLHWKHIGIYGFRRKTLGQLAELLPSKLEQAEKLEQLRWLDAGYTIYAVKVEYESVAVDTAEDVKKVEEILAKRT